MSKIEIINGYKEYIKKKEKISVLENINVKFEKEKLYAIMGESGSGKTTLLNIIGTLDTLTKGKLLINDKEIINLKDEEKAKIRMKEIGFVFQNFYLNPNMTVEENIMQPMYINPEYNRISMEEKTEELIKMVGLESRRTHYPKELSGGEEQRVAIARALALNPKVLLCDEATSALDPNTTKSILSLLQDINKKLNITIIMVTHQMEVIKQICSRVAIMENGEVLEIGETEELFLQNSKNLQKLVGEDDIVLPKGTNIRIIFPKEISNESIITSMARDLDINFSIICGKLEKYRDEILG